MTARLDGSTDSFTVANLAKRFVINPQVDLAILEIVWRAARDDDGRVGDDFGAVRSIELPRALEFFAAEKTDSGIVDDD